MLKRAVVGIAVAVGMMSLAESIVRSHNPVTTTVRFDREVTRILNAKCAQCHAVNGMAMPLQTFDEVRPWAQAIKEEVLARHMPPWFAEDGFARLANRGGLTAREREFLISWIEGGTPPGDGVPSPFVDHSAHWMLGDPEFIARSSGAPQPLPSGFVRFVLDPGADRTLFARAFEFKPGDKRARAAFFWLRETGAYLGGWTPWHPSTELPQSVALRIPKGARILADVWYGPAAPERPAAPRLGLYAGAENAAVAIGASVDAVPVRGSQSVRARYRVSAEATNLLAIHFEPGPGAVSLEAKIVEPNAVITPLVWVREFRPDWPTAYIFASPPRLLEGAVVEVTARFRDRMRPRLRMHVQTATVAVPSRDDASVEHRHH